MGWLAGHVAPAALLGLLSPGVVLARSLGRRPALARMAAVMALAGGLAALAACGGDAGGSADEKELARIRIEAEGTDFDFLEPAKQESLCVSALAIAGRNAGQPLGDEAFALAEDVFLRVGGAPDWFSDGIPEPPEEADETFDEFRAQLGFIEASPASYRPASVVESLHERFVDRATTRLRELEWARNNRDAWVADLQGAGTTRYSWFGLLAIIDGQGASMGATNSEDYAADAAALRYLRGLAERAGEPPDFLDGWAAVIAAVELAAFKPDILESKYEDGTFIYTYTPEAVAAGAANAQELGAAVAAARENFPPPEE